MNDYFEVSSVSIIGTFVSSTPVYHRLGGMPTRVSVHNLVQSHFLHFYSTLFTLFIPIIFSALFQGRYALIASDDSEIFVSNTFGHRVDFFFIAVLKAINSGVSVYRQQQAFLRLNFDCVSVNDIVIDEIGRNSAGNYSD